MHRFPSRIDTQYPFTSISHTRRIVRGLIQRADGLFIMTHIFDDDQFGHRDYYETPGGGIEGQETLEEALSREIQEECGLLIDHITPIGLVEDYYNLIQRKNVNHFMFARMRGTCSPSWTEGETRRIKGLPWLTLEQILAHYDQLPTHGIAQLIVQRERPIVFYLKNNIEKFPSFV